MSLVRVVILLSFQFLPVVILLLVLGQELQYGVRSGGAVLLNRMFHLDRITSEPGWSKSILHTHRN